MDMEIRLKLRRIGSSFMISIPSQVVEDLKLKLGDSMLLDVKDSKIIIRKENKWEKLDLSILPSESYLKIQKRVVKKITEEIQKKQTD